MKDFQAAGSIASLTLTVAHLFAVTAPRLSAEQPLESVVQLRERVLDQEPIDRCLIFCPDALGCHIWHTCPNHITHIAGFANVCVPVSSVVPPKTPVCFASMFTGAQPAAHGIRKYKRPVLKCETLFDALIRANKKIAIIAVADSSVDLIFRDRRMDYFSERYDQEVMDRALVTISENRHGLVVVYQQEHHDLLHETEPFSHRCVQAVNNHVASFREIANAACGSWNGHKSATIFAPDHGAHVDTTSGHDDHGLDTPEDMNLFHWYGVFTQHEGNV